MIEIRELNKKYGSKQVLTDVNLSIEKGKVYGIVGRNGAGKTTMFRCIIGLESHQGEIHSELEPLKNHTGFLPTNPFMMSRITAWEYLKLHSIARNIKTEDFEDKNIFNLPLNEYAMNYSTGMKKKLALMAIFLQKNDLYILDEPFNGVDIQSNFIITKIISQMKESGKTVLISSHIFSTLKDCCDQIFLLKEGRIDKTVDPSQYHILEEEMKSDIIGDQLDKIKF